jgi:hypothetical protein
MQYIKSANKLFKDEHNSACNLLFAVAENDGKTYFLAYVLLLYVWAIFENGCYEFPKKKGRAIFEQLVKDCTP